jgi:hypothetical protein
VPSFPPKRSVFRTDNMASPSLASVAVCLLRLFCTVVGLPVPAGERPHALFAPLYRSTHRRCRAGAAVENLARISSLNA